MRSDREDELGVRLRRDSARLAARYPAKTPPLLSVRGGHPRWFLSVVPFVLASAALLVLIAVSRQPGGNESGVPQQRRLADASEQTIANLPTGFSDVTPSTVSDGHGSNRAALVPADTSQWESPVFLLEVSDPELEALLDLWETDRTERTRLSI